MNCEKCEDKGYKAHEKLELGCHWICECEAGKRINAEINRHPNQKIEEFSRRVNPKAFPEGDQIPRPDGVKLLPDTKMTVMLEYKCRKCGVTMTKGLRLNGVVAPEQQAKVLMDLFTKHAFMTHECEGRAKGFVAFADCMGGAFWPAIHTSGLAV